MKDHTEWVLILIYDSGREIPHWTGTAAEVVREARICLAGNPKLKYRFAERIHLS